ncbi:MAG TPA: flagellar biosynthesis regulator FlaF [Devosiaceae bacterium]|jgi:flagellar protein FlaF
MQQQAALAYQTVAKKTVSARDSEANLLSRSAAQLQLVRDGWNVDRSGLGAAIDFNRKIWVILVTSATRADNPLPDAIKQNIGNLGLFIMKQTVAMGDAPAPEKLDVLININRQLAAGLRAAQE